MIVVMWGMFFAAPTQAQTIAVDKTQLIFAATPQGVSSASQTVTVGNTGNATLSIGAINIIGGNSAGSFSSTKTCGNTLARGRTCTISVTFKPLATGTLNSVLNIFNNGSPGGLKTVNLSGTGTAPRPLVSITPTSIAFGSVGTGLTSGPISVTVRNSGIGSITFPGISASITQANASGFVIVSNTCASAVPTGATCQIGVSFSPTSGGNKTGTLNIITSNASPLIYSVALTGSGVVPTPVLALTPTRATLTCSTPYTGPVTTGIAASNTGTASLTLGTVTFSGTGGTRFSAIKGCSTLAPKEVCGIAVTYTPTGRATQTTTMTVASTTQGVASRTVSLTGSCPSAASP